MYPNFAKNVSKSENWFNVGSLGISNLGFNICISKEHIILILIFALHYACLASIIKLKLIRILHLFPASKNYKNSWGVFNSKIEPNFVKLYCKNNLPQNCLGLSLVMAIQVVEFSNGGYKIRKVA